MTFKDLIVLLPCQSLENLSLDRDGGEAEQLLAAWTSLYHPALLALAPGMPRWASADSPPEDTAQCLVVVPQCAEDSLPADWVDRAESSGARLVRKLQRREEILAAALEGLAEAAPLRECPMAPDFLALGFAHLEVELLTRQLRYMSNLDVERFQHHTLEAMESLKQGDESGAHERLRSAFDRLTEAREYFYPVETQLIDLTLVAQTTLGESLRRELASDRPVNLLVSGAVIEQMAAKQPASLALLREQLDKGNVTLIGGEYEEHELPLLTMEDIAGQLRRGLEAYQRHLGHRPTIFGRRRFGLSPVLPQILKRLGFTAALHFTLDEGRFPTGNQSKIRWEGLDGADIEALARIPLEVHRPENFLRLASRLGNTLDSDHGGCLVFAHWPGQTSPWFEDLRHMGRYGPALGKFTGLGTYFQNTMYSGQSIRHPADKYRSPYLKQDVAADRPDPISRWVHYHRRSVLAGDSQAASTMVGLVRGRLPDGPAEGAATVHAAMPRGTSATEWAGAAAADETACRLDEAAAAWAASIVGPQAGSPGGSLLVNPRSHALRWPVEVSELHELPDVARPILAAAESQGLKQVLLEAPALGFAWVGPASRDPAAARPSAKRAERPRDEPPLVEENVLRNEYLQVRVNPTSGGIQSIQGYALRGNRLAQQIAMRLPPPSELQHDLDPEAEEHYSLMAADDVSARMLGPMVGAIVTRGRLVDREGKRLARFVQTMTVRRGSPILEVEIELEIKRLPEPDPWDSYYAARFAWTDETADVFRGLGLCSQATEGRLVETPYYIDVRAPRTRFVILPAGLPYHRRFGLRKVDTLLVVHGETARKFRLAVGVDLKHPAHAAVDAMARPAELLRRGPAPKTPWGWLFHLDARNVVATHWEPLAAAGSVTGLRVRLLETEGRGVELGLRSFRPVASARKLDFLGGLQSELSVDEDQISIPLGPREWTEVEAQFAACQNRVEAP